MRLKDWFKSFFAPSGPYVSGKDPLVDQLVVRNASVLDRGLDKISNVKHREIIQKASQLGEWGSAAAEVLALYLGEDITGLVMKSLPEIACDTPGIFLTALDDVDRWDDEWIPKDSVMMTKGWGKVIRMSFDGSIPALGYLRHEPERWRLATPEEIRLFVYYNRGLCEALFERKSA